MSAEITIGDQQRHPGAVVHSSAAPQGVKGILFTDAEWSDLVTRDKKVDAEEWLGLTDMRKLTQDEALIVAAECIRRVEEERPSDEDEVVLLFAAQWALDHAKGAERGESPP